MLEEFAQCTQDLEIIAGPPLGGAEHEQKVHGTVGALKGDSDATSTDRQDNCPHMFRAGMRQGYSIAETRGIQAIPGHKLLKETIKLQHIATAGQRAGKLFKCGIVLDTLKFEDDACWIKKL